MSGNWEPDWLTLTGLGLGALAAGTLGVLASALMPLRARRYSRALGLGTLAAGLAVAAAGLHPQRPWPAALAAAVVGLAVLAPRPGLGRLGARACAGVTRVVGPCGPWPALVAVGVALSAGGLYHLRPDPDSLAELDPARYPSLVLLQGLAEDPTAAAWTDRGRKVRLLLPPDVELARGPLEAQESELARGLGPRLQLIRTAPPDWRSDCHGWTFADGRWWVLGEDVAAILEDNGYRTAAEPAAGDLVIYRDATGTTVHSGVVFAAPPGGPVLVESKWAWLGCYLHAPEDQPYGLNLTYYRTGRGGHRLRGLDGQTPLGPALHPVQ